MCSACDCNSLHMKCPLCLHLPCRRNFRRARAQAIRCPSHLAHTCSLRKTKARVKQEAACGAPSLSGVDQGTCTPHVKPQSSCQDGLAHAGVHICCGGRALRLLHAPMAWKEAGVSRSWQRSMTSSSSERSTRPSRLARLRLPPHAHCSASSSSTPQCVEARACGSDARWTSSSSERSTRPGRLASPRRPEHARRSGGMIAHQNSACRYKPAVKCSWAHQLPPVIA